MGAVKTKKYVKNPLYVDAVRLTGKNFDGVVKWCNGRAQTESTDHPHSPGAKYIKLHAHNPINTRQTKAYIGDWVLKTNRGFKVYTHKAFGESFQEARTDRSVEAQVEAFAEEEDELDSCANPRTQLDTIVPQ